MRTVPPTTLSGQPEAASRRQRSTSVRVSDAAFGRAISLPGVAALLLLVGAPICLLFVIAMMDYRPPLIQEFIGLSNYKKVLHDPLFKKALINSLIYGAGVTLITLVVGCALGVALSKINRFSTFFRTIGLFPWAVPLVVSALIWKWFLDPQVGDLNAILFKLGLLHSNFAALGNPILAMASVITADAWTRVPFLSIFVLAGIENIPQSVLEAARVDGANAIQSFMSITLPLIRAPLLTGLLIVSMFSFRALETVFVMTQGGPGRSTYTLPYYIADQMWIRADFGGGSAVGVVLLLIIGAFALAYVYFINNSPDGAE